MPHAADQWQQGTSIMAGAVLLGVQKGIERYNAAFPDPFYSDHIGTYLVPVFIIGTAVSFMPAVIAASREIPTVRKIFLLDAAAPLAIFMLLALPFGDPLARQAIHLLISLAVCGGVIAWASTLLEALTTERRATVTSPPHHLQK
ncbi:MAG TPA: hypothetical protein VG271_08475 [Beijerinckiaceae bacterium]|nr:hypothetical protein [Beijerinckiaceae bacterium]